MSLLHLFWPKNWLNQSHEPKNPVLWILFSFMCVGSVWHIGWCAKILTPPTMKKENVLRMFDDLSTNTSLAKRDVGSSWNKTSSSAAIINANLKKKNIYISLLIIFGCTVWLFVLPVILKRNIYKTRDSKCLAATSLVSLPHFGHTLLLFIC